MKDCDIIKRMLTLPLNEASQIFQKENTKYSQSNSNIQSSHSGQQFFSNNKSSNNTKISSNARASPSSFANATQTILY